MKEGEFIADIEEIALVREGRQGCSLVSHYCCVFRFRMTNLWFSERGCTST